jgi:guanylate kinase
MSAIEGKQVVVIAGPAGSGKDTIAREIVKRYPNATLMVTVTTRAKRPGEEEGINYHFLTNEQFKKELEAGNIPEYYHRAETDTYYGTYKQDIDSRLESGKVVFAVIQIVGAKYLKEHYNATTIFIMPPSVDAFEKRIRARSPMSDVEWQERLKFTQAEVANESPWYDYRISNEDGKLEEAISEVVGILKKEGYNLG